MPRYPKGANCVAYKIGSKHVNPVYVASHDANDTGAILRGDTGACATWLRNNAENGRYKIWHRDGNDTGTGVESWYPAYNNDSGICNVPA